MPRNHRGTVPREEVIISLVLGIQSMSQRVQQRALEGSNCYCGNYHEAF
jgi:hypothetical protein